MFLFGGSNLENENTNFYCLDLAKFRWETIKSRGDLPITRDEHTAVINQNDNSMIIFGGFCDGMRTNETMRYSFTENKWNRVQHPPGENLPKPRSKHSAVVYNNVMYIFGGKDDDNNKLNDMWKLDLTTNSWSQVIPEFNF